MGEGSWPGPLQFNIVYKTLPPPPVKKNSVLLMILQFAVDIVSDFQFYCRLYIRQYFLVR